MKTKICTAQIHFHLKRPHTITKMYDNKNMYSKIAENKMYINFYSCHGTSENFFDIFILKINTEVRRIHLYLITVVFMSSMTNSDQITYDDLKSII
jgi:hypothetical protein